MAKGRRLTTSRSEHFLGTYAATENYNNYGYNQTITTALIEDSEFREEDVWSIVDRTDTDRDDDIDQYGNSDGAWGARPEHARGGEERARIPRRRGGRDNSGSSSSRHMGGLSLAFDESKTASSRIVHQHRGVHENGGGGGGQDPSTPRRSNHHHNHNVAASAPVNVPDWNRILRVNSVESINDSSDELTGFENDDSEGWFPPHEYLARSRKTAATSVFQGVGRTLKGRDMSRLRDAVWSQTGFDG